MSRLPVIRTDYHFDDINDSEHFHYHENGDLGYMNKVKDQCATKGFPFSHIDIQVTPLKRCEKNQATSLESKKKELAKFLLVQQLPE